MGAPHKMVCLQWRSLLKWMMNRGTRIYGNHHMYISHPNFFREAWLLALPQRRHMGEMWGHQS